MITYDPVHHSISYTANGTSTRIGLVDPGSTVTWGGSIDPGSHSTSYQVAGVADFDGDGSADVLWRNPTTGRVDEWHMANGTWAGSIDLGSRGPEWQIVSTRDLTSDGTADVLWRNSTAGQIDEWVMANGELSRSIDFGSHGADWKVIGTGTFWQTGTYFGQVFFQNVMTGQMDEWIVDRNGWVRSVPLGSYGLDWQLAAVGDFNWDGAADLLWRNPTTGQLDEWQMGNGSFGAFGQWAASIRLGSHGTEWQVAGVGNFDYAPLTHSGAPPPAPDFLGDDILWQNPSTGQTDIWLMDRGQWIGSVSAGSHDPSFQIAGVGDLNHDNNPDILWRNPGDGRDDIWLTASVGPIHARDYLVV